MIGEEFWNLPAWLIIVMVTLLLMGGHELGVQIRRRTSRRVLKDLDEEGVGGSYMTTSLSLLALLVAFSFGMAVDRYNTRRNLVVEEANAITTFHRRLQTIDGPQRAALGRDLLDYLAAREAFSRSRTERELTVAEAQTETTQRRVWNGILGSFRASEASARGALDAADRMFTVAATRRAALEAVVPTNVLLALLAYAVIASVVMGYSHRADRRFLVASSVQFALLATALGLIVDLDRPRAGLVQVNQAPLLRSVAAIRRAEASRPAPTTTNSTTPGESMPRLPTR